MTEPTHQQDRDSPNSLTDGTAVQHFGSRDGPYLAYRGPTNTNWLTINKGK